MITRPGKRPTPDFLFNGFVAEQIYYRQQYDKAAICIFKMAASPKA
jgi:hypothetical protein